MKRLLPLIVLALGACDAPFEEFYPARELTYGTGADTLDVRAQFDPLEQGWFTQVSSRSGKLGADDRAMVFALVESQVGPEICEGAAMKVEPSKVWTGYGATTIRYLPTNGVWQLVGQCV